MKFLTIILSVYIFALNLAPCDDYAAPDNEVKTEVSQTVGKDNQHLERDSCSPFCQCHCCHINVINSKIADVKFNRTYISTQDFFYFNYSEEEFYISVLQPPQV